MGGYTGKILFVDLSNSQTRIKPLAPDFARQYIGGLGFGTKLYLDLIEQNPFFDALSQQNPIVIMTGPLTGIKLNGVARWTIGTKSPQTGFWGDSNCGGFWGAYLKFAGFDGMVIQGKAFEPVYIHIDDQDVKILPASDLWGKDIYTVTDELKNRYRNGSKKSGQVLAIGQAGENLVKFASVISGKGHAAGRTGIGAVFGSKLLKAIMVQGSGKVNIARIDEFKQIKSELKPAYDESIGIDALRSAGTASHMDVGIISGDIPIKNWQMSDWELFDDIGPGAIEEKIMAGNGTCFGCAVACKKQAKVDSGPFKMDKGPGPEYETVASFGTMCLNHDIESIAKANELCNRYGMDTISCGATIAFAMECFEKGLIDANDTHGIDLCWGNAKAIVEMVHQIANKKGFGEILAQGSANAARQIGKGAQNFLTTVKGLEAPMHDPRSSHGYGLAYATSPRGACHMASLQYSVEGGLFYFPEFTELEDGLEPLSSEHKAKANVLTQDFGMFFSSCAAFCNLGASVITATQAVDLVNAVTGFDFTLSEVLQAGRRIWYLKRGLSNLFGATRIDDMLPARLLTPLPNGPTQGSVPDMEQMTREFYDLRDLNQKGLPSREVLSELNLNQLLNILYA